MSKEDNNESNQSPSQESNKKKPLHYNAKKKRAICYRCKRPTPAACICPSLPNEPLAPFQKCRVIVLQHPHELRRKNRSLPLIELCLQSEKTKSTMDETKKQDDNSKKDALIQNKKTRDDFQMQTVIGRRLGEKTPSEIMTLIQKPNVLLLYPDDTSVTLQEGLKIIQNRTSKTSCIIDKDKDEVSHDESYDGKVTLIFIDATWKYAKEMHLKNTSMNLWPKDLVRVKLSPTIESHPKNDDNEPSSTNSTKDSTDSSNSKLPTSYKPRRFDIRTPPSENHLSTAECIAWVVSAIEQDGSIYETLMKPLDYMVKLWHSFDSNRGHGWIDSKNDKRKGKLNSRGKDEKEVRKRPKLFFD